MQVTATEAKNGFGQSEVLQTLNTKKSLAQRRKVFSDNYKDWIAEQNRHFEAQGLWCDGFVASHCGF